MIVYCALESVAVLWRLRSYRDIIIEMMDVALVTSVKPVQMIYTWLQSYHCCQYTMLSFFYRPDNLPAA